MPEGCIQAGAKFWALGGCKEQGAVAEKCSGEQGAASQPIAAQLHMQKSPLQRLQPVASFSLPAIDAAAQESPD